MNRIFRKVLKIVGVIILLLAILFGVVYYNSVNYSMYELAADRSKFPEVKNESDIEALAEKLVSEMTLEEKIDQMYGESRSSGAKMGINYLIHNRFPHVYVGGNERLNIPPWVLSDGPRGARVMDKDVYGVTTFPVAMARGASWNTDLENRIHQAIAIEMRANKTNYAATPCLNLLRHPAWGRAQETYGEDPYHLGEFGVAAVKGIEAHNVMACPKHFALNSLDNSRYYVDVRVDERTLREVYLPHFKKTIQEGEPASIMSAYNLVNGEYSANNKYLLTDILRDDWGFKGFVTSDWVQGTDDGIASVKAGLEVEMPFQNYYSDKILKEGIENGQITESDIDLLVLRSLRTRLKYAFAEDSMEYTKDLIASDEHTALARRAAEESMVLIKNKNVLPFSEESGKKILILGRLADVENTGDRASSDTTPTYVVTPYEGIFNMHKNSGSEVELYDGDDLELARSKAANADEVILVVGYTYQEEGEYINIEGEYINVFGDPEASAKAGKLIGRKGMGGDRESLRLLKQDEELIEAVAGSNPRIVVVYVGGSAIDMAPWESDIPAILFSWYSGMEGGNALANILYGKVNPSGKLPFSIAEDSSDYPYFTPYTKEITYGYYHGYSLFDKEKINVAYPFGFGLSYTDFDYSGLAKDQSVIGPDGKIQVSVDVTNSGERSGSEIVQLYIGFANSSIDRPVKLLKGFDKIKLAAGETQTVRFEVEMSDLSWYDPESKQWKVEEMHYEIYVGPSSDRNRLLIDSFEIKQEI